MQIITESKQKQEQKSNTNQLLTTGTLLNRGMTVDECRIMCTQHSIDLREKLFFRIIYETQLRPFEVLNLQVEQWDRKQGFVTALKVKQKTKPRKGDHRAKDRLPSIPKTRAITPSTNEMLREYVSNRKKGPVFVNENGEMLSLPWLIMLTVTVRMKLPLLFATCLIFNCFPDLKELADKNYIA